MLAAGERPFDALRLLRAFGSLRRSERSRRELDHASTPTTRLGIHHCEPLSFPHESSLPVFEELIVDAIPSLHGFHGGRCEAPGTGHTALQLPLPGSVSIIADLDREEAAISGRILVFGWRRNASRERDHVDEYCPATLNR